MTDFPVKSRVIRRQTIYWLVGIGLTAVFATVQASDATSAWRSGSQLHTIMETMATLVALIIGCLALFRYYSQKELAILFIGLGFLGTAFLDGYHTFVTSEFFAPLMPSDLPSLSPWSWIASRQYLSVLMLLSFLYSRHQSEAEPTNRTVNERSLYIGASALTVFCFLFFAFVPLPTAYFPELYFHRPEEFAPALFFLWALTGFIKSGRWKTDLYEHWLILSLVVAVISQTLFISHSATLFDFDFDFAHLLKIARLRTH